MGFRNEIPPPVIVMIAGQRNHAIIIANDETRIAVDVFIETPN